MAHDNLMVPAGHGMLTIPGDNGDTRLMWKHGDQLSIDQVRARFDEMIAQGFGAYASPTGRVDDATMTRTFDPEARTVTMLRQPVGG